MIHLNIKLIINMKRSIYLVAAVLFLAAGFLSSCGDDEKEKHETIAVKSITFSLSSVDLPLGNEDKVFTVALNYALEPVRSNNIESITWNSSNEGVATVSATGLVTSLELGETVIKVTVKTTDGKTLFDNCTVTVVPPPVEIEKIEFDSEGQILAPASSVNLSSKVIITPETASNKSLIWESNKEKIATVNNDGLVTAAADTFGLVVISATTVDGGLKARYTLDVRVVVTGVELVAPSNLVFQAGVDVQLEAKVLPATATNTNVFWESSNTTVATIDGKGKVSTKGIGKTTITLTTEEGEFEATCEIEVIPTAVTGVEFDSNEKLEMKVADEVTLKVNILPNTATNQKLLWESSDTSVATVDENGKVTAKDAGTATITVTTDEGGFKDTRDIEASRIPVTGMYLGNDITANAIRIVYEGINSVFNLTAVVEPSNATIKTIDWVSSDENVAVMDETGKLTFKGPGTVTITATTVEGGFTSSLALNINHFYSWLPRTNWSIYGWTSAYDDNRDGGPGWSSQAPYDGGARITSIVTDNDGQFWHASWSDPSTNYPHWFIVDLGESKEFDAVMLRRRSDNSGTSNGYFVYTSNSLSSPPVDTDWTYRGDYTFNRESNSRQVMPLEDGAVNARYIKLYFDPKHRGGSNYAMFSQFGLYLKK